MAIYEIRGDELKEIERTSFRTEGIKERENLQRLLRSQIEIIAPDTRVISEEFCEWQDSRRRIDLLGLDTDANLVVFELKTVADGGHMELQAIRYAAMVSTMTFDKAVEVYQDYLLRIGEQKQARASILEFLGWDEPDEERFAQDVRVVLVAPSFSKEITTAVMWLNARDLDIRCVRLRPYNDAGRILLESEQVVPLPEAKDYIINIREKAERERHDRKDRNEREQLRIAFWSGLLDRARPNSALFANISPSADSWISAGGGISGFHFIFYIRKHDATVAFVLERDKEQNKRDFDAFSNHRRQIDEAFKSPLEWDRFDELKKSSIGLKIPGGGYRDDRDQWPAIQETMIDHMIRLEKAVRPFIDKRKA